MKGMPRMIVAAIAGLAVTLAVNTLGIVWLRATQFDGDAFYDGWTALVTLLVPSLLGGFLIGWFAREHAANVTAAAFALFCLVGLVHPFWRIPLVSPQSAHSGLMHYFLYNPLVALAFGSLGGWLGGQFATGRFTLADREPVCPKE